MSLEARLNRLEKSVNESNDVPCPHLLVIERFEDDAPLEECPPCEHQGCTGERAALVIHLSGMKRSEALSIREGKTNEFNHTRN